VMGEGEGRRLIGYVVADVDIADLREALARQLPDHMVPSEIVGLASLPLMPNGKVDRAALETLAPPAPAARPQAVPRSATELALAALWAEVLDRSEPGIDESFFDLGGHSLLLARLQTRIGEEMGRDVPLLKLIEHPTIAACADWLDGEGEGEVQVAPGEGRDREQRRRESLEQQRRRMAGRRATS